ncbi:MAG: hypothetical protein ACI4EK_07865 [Wujia sp.]
MNEQGFPYEDIVGLARPVSKYPSMDRLARAAQFAPFAALTGHDEAVRETARLTEEEIELDEYEISDIDRKLQWLCEHPGTEVSITHFVKDEKKAGGAYLQDTGTVKKVDTYENKVVLDCGEERLEIKINKIIEILI